MDAGVFPSKDEALAFVKGYRVAMDLVGDDHTTITEPSYDELSGDWHVYFGSHV